jgi:hypothetical protein
VQKPERVDSFFPVMRHVPGEGKFHIKGTGYLFHDQWVEKFLPGGREAQLRELGELGAHPFFRQSFMAGTMYDVLPLVALGYACASIRGESLESFVRMRARYQAERDLQYIRKWLVKMASPSMVARRFPSILTSYFDFGTPESQDLPNGTRGIVAGVPTVLATWMTATCTGFAEHALEVNGANGIRVETKRVARPDRIRDHSVVDLHFEFRWQVTEPPPK